MQINNARTQITILHVPHNISAPHNANNERRTVANTTKSVLQDWNTSRRHQKATGHDKKTYKLFFQTVTILRDCPISRKILFVRAQGTCQEFRKPRVLEKPIIREDRKLETWGLLFFRSGLSRQNDLKRHMGQNMFRWPQIMFSVVWQYRIHFWFTNEAEDAAKQKSQPSRPSGWCHGHQLDWTILWSTRE